MLAKSEHAAKQRTAMLFGCLGVVAFVVVSMALFTPSPIPAQGYVQIEGTCASVTQMESMTTLEMRADATTGSQFGALTWMQEGGRCVAAFSFSDVGDSPTYTLAAGGRYSATVGRDAITQSMRVTLWWGPPVGGPVSVVGS